MSGGARHIAVVAPPLAGHYQPLLVLADALIARGHRVTFVHMADARALASERAAGFEPVGARTHGAGALDRYVRRLARAGGPFGLPSMIRANAGVTAMLLDDLPGALARIGADAVLAESSEAAGGLVARRMGLPFATTHTGLPLNREPGVPPPFVGWPYAEGERALGRNRAGYRVADWLLRPVDRLVADRAREWDLPPLGDGGFSPLLQVAQCPEGLDFPRTELPASFRYCGPFRAAADESVDLPDDRPLVFCSLGSVQGDRPRLFAAMARACADLGARAVIGHGGRLSDARARAMPGGALVRAFWPQRAVLARCSAAILHGGFNTVADALAAGVPIVALPIAFEQPATAARIARTGAGRVLRGPVGRRRLRRELGRVLSDPSHRAAAERLRAGIDGSGGVELAADLIDAAFRTGRVPPPAPSPPGA